MKLPLLTATLVVPSGCAYCFGPAHGVFDAVGSTPENRSCQLTLAPVGSNGEPTEWTVSGEFRKRVMVNHSREGRVIALSCDNTVVATRTFKYGRDVDILGELEIHGSFP